MLRLERVIAEEEPATRVVELQKLNEFRGMFLSARCADDPPSAPFDISVVSHLAMILIAQMYGIALASRYRLDS